LPPKGSIYVRDHTARFGEDGALEHERERIQPGEDPGITGTPADADKRGGGSATGQAQRKQDHDLASGEENPG